MGARRPEPIEREFLPAALAAVESPPSPTGRTLLWLVLLLFSLGLLWAGLGEVDIVVSAPGRIVPSGQVKIVQAPEGGTVSALLVREGDRVVAGQPLIRLDSTYADADRLRLREQLDDVGLHGSWRRELALWLAGNGSHTIVPAGPSMDARGVLTAHEVKAGTLYAQQRAEIGARLGALDREHDAILAERAMARAERERVEATLAILQERVAAHKALLDKQYGARVRYLELLQAQTELDRSIPVLAARERKLTASSAALAARRQATLGEQRNQNLLELARLDSQGASLAQELRKAGQRQRQQLILAPVSGTVQELALHTVGGVVSSAQPLLKIVPGDAPVEAEALLHNRDIGFVREGQPVRLKVTTFNFTRYGLIAARVANISKDAVQDPQLGWVFKMRVQLEQDQLAVEDRVVSLSPGMAVTAEIRTGQRRLIEFFLSPLLRYRQESVRER